MRVADAEPLIGRWESRMGWGRSAGSSAWITGQGRLRGLTFTPVHGAFGTVLWVVCIAAAVVALLMLMSTRKTWEDLGKNSMLMDSELPRQAAAPSAASLLERDEEIRQMLQARNARRIRRGEAPVDVEQELSKLTSSTDDPAL